MYTFKIKDAEVAIRAYLRKHPSSKVAGNANLTEGRRTRHCLSSTKHTIASTRLQ